MEETAGKYKKVIASEAKHYFILNRRLPRLTRFGS